MKNLTLLAPLFALSALASCASVPPVSNDQWAGIGDATRVGPLVVQPMRVTDDSRCPMNARCVWAGRVTLEALVVQDGKTSSITIHSDVPAAVNGGVLEIDEITPGSFMTNERPQQADYRFHFILR